MTPSTTAAPYKDNDNIFLPTDSRAEIRKLHLVHIRLPRCPVNNTAQRGIWVSSVSQVLCCVCALPPSPPPHGGPGSSLGQRCWAGSPRLNCFLADSWPRQAGQLLVRRNSCEQCEHYICIYTLVWVCCLQYIRIYIH